MNSTDMMKQKIINDYMSLIDLNNINNIDYKKIEQELSLALNEKPAVKLIYEDDTLLNEDGKPDKKISKLKTIEIYYTYNDNTGLKFAKKSFIIA